MNNFRNMTLINPDGKTHRVMVTASAKNTRILTTPYGEVELYGEIADRLGAYEKICMEPDALFEMLKKHNLLPKEAREKAWNY